MNLMNFFKRHPGVHRSVHIGHWTRIGTGVKIARDTTLGDWTNIGDNARIGPGCTFGPWAGVDKDAHLGANVTLGSHTRVMAGVTIPDGATFADGDLVTPGGVIANRNGGYALRIYEDADAALLRSSFGCFLLPLSNLLPNSLSVLHEFEADSEVSAAINEYRWGRFEEMELYRIDSDATPKNHDEIITMLAALRANIAQRAEVPRSAEDLDQTETLTIP